MPSFLLIHSPRAGAFTWAPVAQALQARGYPVCVPALDFAEAPFWPHFAATIEAAARVTLPAEGGIVAVAHSAGGLLLPLVAARLRAACQRVVFADASLPAPARTLLDGHASADLAALRAAVGPDGCLPPWGEEFDDATWELLVPAPPNRAAFRASLPRVPWALFEERLPDIHVDDRLCAYLHFSAYYVPLAREAADRGWPVVTVPGEHCHMLVDPEGVAEALIGLVGPPAPPPA